MYTETFKDMLFVFEQDISDLAQIYTKVLPNVNKQHAQQCNPKAPYGWYGGIKSVDDARIILENGWSDGAEKALHLKAVLENELPKARTRKRKQVWMSEGESIDIDRALAGNWDYAYRGTMREYAAGISCITLNIGWGGNCDKSSDQLFWSGAVMLVLCDALEMAGFSVKLNAINKLLVPGGFYCLNIINVKNHGEPLRVDALAGIVCHAGIFRTYGFRTICNAPWNVGSYLGTALTWNEINPALKKAEYSFDPNTIIVNDCYSKDSAIAEINRIVKYFNNQ